ncbi:MAG: alpha-galactosidase [Clostridia bacterium]|nr:alpha-galactosidase [Clostridia bacterium]
MKPYSEFVFGDMLLRYFLDDRNCMSMLLIPVSMREKALQKEYRPEPLVQLHARGDHFPDGYGNGHTLAGTSASYALKFVSQTRNGNTVETVAADETGRTVRHRVSWSEGLQGLTVSCLFENKGPEPVTLNLLSSVSLSGITPFTEADAPGALFLHRICSMWSAEGRVKTESIEEAMLERSWTGHALRLCKFGQLGSMPVRGFFPFAALEDRKAGVTWAVQLACPSSWMMEIRRKDDCLSLMASLPDEDYGRWAKTVRPGESFETPEAYLTAGCGGLDEVSQRLLTLHRKNLPRPDRELPILFNEYCTTWGNPTHENLKRIAECLDGRGPEYLVIDAGWYRNPKSGWSDCGGDWIPEEQEMFPEGLKATAEMIRAHGMRPGLWFEPETCAGSSEIARREDLLLTRDGAVIDTDNRRFLDLRKEEVHAYLEDRVVGLLKRCGFEYIKIDYNDCIGIGCDDPDSLGEGLRRNMQGTLRFFRRLREAIPELMIENCSSGGHRLEPSLMAVSDMASFSDAHECREIPIIAAALHRVILPAQSQIWAVLRAEDSLRRINYSLINTFLGVMCLSGDVTGLSEEQWRKTEEGMDFYREVRPLIRDGVSSFLGTVSESWRHPEGWQAVIRTDGKETLAVIHTFGGEIPEKITLPVRADRILRVMCSEGNAVSLEGNELTVSLKAEFEAVAVHLAAGRSDAGSGGKN